MTASDELTIRISKLQDMMQENRCQGLMVLQNADLYYFAGTIQNAALYVPDRGEPLLFCRKSAARARQESPWTVIPVNSFKAIPAELSAVGSAAPHSLALEMDVIPASTYRFLAGVFHSPEISDASPWIKRLRSIKSPAEIELLRASARLMAGVYQEAPRIFKAGRTELECACEIEKQARWLGHQGLVRCRAFNQELFFGHLLSGSSGGVPSYVDGASGGSGPGAFFPQGSGHKIIAANEPISLDYVAVFGGYAVDLTRMFVIGRLPVQLQIAFQLALKIQDHVMSAVKPGITPSRLYNLALAMAEEAGLGDHFMGYLGSQTKFVGHGVGLELDELPILAAGHDEPLEAGMVFALEPKFVFPGMGMAGIENTWLVTECGADKITDFPDDLIVIA